MKRSWREGALALVTVAAIAVGCGGGGGGGSARHRVTVQIPTLNAAPAIYALLLNDSAGRLVSSISVTSPGTQVVQIPHAGSVTFAAAVGSTSFRWTTVVDPPDGATLHFGNRLPAGTPPPTPPPPSAYQTWSVTVAAVPGAARYVVFGPCGYNGNTSVASPISVTSQDCAGVTSAKIFVAAMDSGSQPIAWHETSSLPATPGGTTSLAVTLDQTAVVETHSIFQNLPHGAGQVSAYFESADPSFVQRFYRPAGFSYTALNAGQSIAGIVLHTPAFGNVLTMESVFGGQGGIVRYRRLAAPPGSIAFDLRGLELPVYPTFDGPSRTFHWGMPMFGFGQTLDMFLVDQSGPPTVVEVRVALPPGVQTYVLPELPPAFLPSDSLGEYFAQGGSVAPDVASVASHRDFVEHFEDDPVLGFQSQDGVFLLAQPPN